MFESVIAEISAVTVDGRSRRELADSVEALRRVKGVVAALELRLVAAIDRLGDSGLDGAGVLRVAGRVSSRSAAATAKTASMLESMPAAAEALSSGRITAEHAITLADAAGTLGDPAGVDSALVAKAQTAPADLFAKRTRQWLSEQPRPDDGEDEYQRQRSARTAREWIDRSTKMGHWHLETDPVTHRDLTAAIRARQRQFWQDDGGRDGTPDAVRSPDQRLADAIVDLLTHTGTGSASGDLAGGCRPPHHPRHQLNVIVDATRLTRDDPTGHATIVDGQPLPQSVLERLACDAVITPILYGGAGQPIWVGRDHRTATIAQWKALIARDRGCVTCGALIDRCQAHHLIPWEPSGHTDIDNLVLLCTRCHHDVHDRHMALHRHPDGTWELVSCATRTAEAAATPLQPSRAGPARQPPGDPRSDTPP